MLWVEAFSTNGPRWKLPSNSGTTRMA